MTEEAGGLLLENYFFLLQARYPQYFELEDLLSPGPGGKAGGIALVNYSVVSGIKIVHFTSDVGKISAILQAGGSAEPQSWWQGRQHTASQLFCGGWHKDSSFLFLCRQDIGNISSWRTR
jgi:hypothetical protein